MKVLTEDQLWELDVPTIKRKLHECSLPRFGNKADLILRLVNYWRTTQAATEPPVGPGPDDRLASSRRPQSQESRLPHMGGSGVASSSSQPSWLDVGGTTGRGQPAPPPPPPPAHPLSSSYAPPYNPYPFYVPHPDSPSYSNRTYPSFEPSSGMGPSFAPRRPNEAFPLSGVSAEQPPPQQHPSSNQYRPPSHQPNYSIPPPHPGNLPYYDYPYRPSSSSSASHLPSFDPPPPHRYPSFYPPVHPAQPPRSSLAGEPTSSTSSLSVPSSSSNKRKSLSVPGSPQPRLQRARSTTFDLTSLHLVDPTLASLPPQPDRPEQLPLADAAQPWRRLLARDIVCENKTMGSMRASFVRREVIGKGTFHRVMVGAERDLGEVALEVFDVDGRLRVEYTKPGGAESGSGGWGSELSIGTFIYLHELVIDSSTSSTDSQGLGFTAFRALLALLDTLRAQRTIPYIPHFMLAHPRMLEDPTGEPPTPEYRDFAVQRAERFFRKVGFRRLGLTPYFAYAVTDVSHPSRHIPLTSDTAALPPLTTPTPTHHRLHTQPYTPLPPTLSAVDLVLQDSHGQTPLHVAVAAGLVERCRELLGRREREGTEALWVLDVKGMSPVELGKRVVSRAREREAAGLEADGAGWQRMEECVRVLEVEMRR